MKVRKEVHPSSSIDGRWSEAQPTGAEDAITGSGEGSKNGAMNWSAEKQGERSDVGNDGRTASQAACHTGDGTTQRQVHQTLRSLKSHVLSRKF